MARRQRARLGSAEHYQRDESLCRVHIATALGKKKLKTLNAADVQRFYRDKLDANLSSATVHKLHVLLHKALKQAERWGTRTAQRG